MEKIRIAEDIFVTEKQKQSLESLLGSHEFKRRLDQLQKLKDSGKRPKIMRSDFQALSAMAPRTVEPIREREKIETMKQALRRNGERDYMLFLTGLNTGLRIGDLLPLTAGDVRRRKYIVLKEEKTNKAKRFALNQGIRRELDDYTRGMADREYLFASRKTGKPIKRDRAYKILRRAAEEAGCDFIGTHTLRKTFGYHFYKQYKDASMLQQIFNHSSQSITLRYIGISQEEIDDAMDDFIL